ncbi:BTAD domain-containing putative transcriptional regulator [Streptomyces sp. NPDC001985]|uniref:AfsR/SARP family transcriptional regulator n=1 Tax=Streptomyces sp. NPDC001985 TaxID=3154406 RepID=UPI0033188C8D
MKFQVLGPLSVVDGGVPVIAGGPKQQALLGLLIARCGTVVPVPQIVDTLWQRSPPSTAQAQIHSRISTLRRVLGTRAIVTHPSGYLLDVAPDAVDAHLFEAEVESALEWEARGAFQKTAAVLRGALGRWRGECAFQMLDGELFDREAGRLAELRLLALEHCIGADLETRDAAELVPELVDLVAAHPTQERLHRHLMVALDRSGRRSDAFNVYWSLRRRLADEFGADPAEDIQQLYQSLLSGTAGDGGPDRPARRPAPCRAGDAAASQLPPDIPDFTGRTSELRQIVARLVNGGAAHADTAPRAVVVTGMPGVGKSTLALRAAHSLHEEFVDGRLYVDAAAYPRSEEGLRAVLGRLLRGLGAAEGTVPESAGERQDLYRSLVASRSVLLVVDNVAGPEDLRAVIPPSGRCAVLVTAQAATLTVEGALRVPLGPLAPEEARSLLFSGLPARRDEEQGPRTEEVLARCAGLPMAIRSVGTLLASRPHWSMAHVTEALSREESWLERLGTPGRSIVSTFDGALRDLPEDDRGPLSALAVFGRTALTPWIAGVLIGRPATRAREVLDRLADRGLLAVRWSERTHSWSYGLHELLRVHLLARMDPAEAVTIQLRALRGWLELAERATGAPRSGGGRTPPDAGAGPAASLFTGGAGHGRAHQEREFLRAVLGRADERFGPAVASGLVIGDGRREPGELLALLRTAAAREGGAPAEAGTSRPPHPLADPGPLCPAGSPPPPRPASRLSLLRHPV